MTQQQEYRPRVEEQRVFDSSVQGGPEFMSTDQCEMDDSQLVGPPAALPEADVAAKLEVVMGVKNEVGAVTEVKRKRGRPPRMQGKAPAPPPPLQRKKKDEEDVCFICFDGGSLVLCDRRGCPKAYHPACIKRDEAFFRSKAKWNCGWHICSTCQKASHYMCYTCTFSLCKGCTKEADYVCVRANKGFCGTCMRTIMLIENIKSGNQETVQVDFDDKTSWEYLFKVYWIYLKEKLSLTLDELTKAKNPWKGDELPKVKSSWKGAGTIYTNGGSPVEIYHNNDVCANLEANHFKRRKTDNQLQSYNEHSLTESGFDKGSTLPEGTSWGTKELLEFVAHMKNGDTSIVTPFDVQVLLLEYIKRNNLRDPHQKCQIVCDSRLMTLFGKARVGHLEMLKLLEYHFLVRDKILADDAGRVGVADVVSVPVEAVGNNDSPLMAGIDRGRKTRKKMGDRGPQINPNPDEYAAIDVHNINLVYLKRTLVENLLDDAEKFWEKVVGSFVRIRIPVSDEKHDIYRLVQVVGTSKAAESYNVGTRITNIMLEILNLDKKEVVSIDGISNQDFTEDECKRLRQSIKFGLIKRLKVGEILEKAMSFRAVKISDWMEAETLRLNHLRDRASEKGHRKELRECVEKLELLKSPMESQRRLLEVPIVHADPTMNPSYEPDKDNGESDDKKQGECLEPRNSGSHRKRKEINSPLGGCDGLSNTGNTARKNSETSYEPSGTTSTTFYVDRDGTTRIHEPVNQVGFANLVAEDWKSHTSSVSQSPLSTGRELEIESEKLWCYQDPTGKVQGPFPMAQLRKWSTSGLFPLHLRVWRTNEKQENSILLTDALVGGCNKEPSLESRNSPLQEVSVASNDTDNSKWENKYSQNADGTGVNKNVEDASDHCNDKMEIMRRIGLATLSPSQTSVADVDVGNGSQVPAQNWGLSKGSMLEPDQPRTTNSLPSSPPSGKSNSPSLQVRESHETENANENLQKATEGQSSAAKSDGNQVDVEGPCSQSSRQNWRPPSIDSSSSGQDSKCAIVSAVEPTETRGRNKDIEFSDLPSSTPNKSNEQLTGLTTENRQSVSSSIAVLDSGPSWSTASSLVVGGTRTAQIPEVAGEWSGYSSTPAKPTVEEWGSNLVSASSLKLTRDTNDHAATPTSGSDQLTHANPTHPTIDVSSWHSIVPDPSEFCSLADESVSDLLAEVEAMESLNGLPSPTSKMRCGELAPGPDNDCFSPVEGFSPARDQGKGDALSSSGDAQIPSQLTLASEILLQLSHYPHFGVTNAPPTSQIPSQLTVPEEPPRISNVTSQSTVMVSEIPSRSTLTDELFGISHTHTSDHQKSSSGNSSSSAEAEGGARPSDVSVNQWEERSELKPPASTRNQKEAGSDTQPRTVSMVRQWDADSDVQRPALSMEDGSWGTMKGNTNVSRVEASHVTQASTNTVWGTGHGTVQHQANAHSATSTANSGNWGSQPKYGGDRYGGDRCGGDRYSGTRDHRNYYQGRDTGYGRDSRSSWNSHRQQPLYGVGNGGSHRPPPKGQRVCKFYGSGNCKRGASCSYWHPQ